MKFRINFEYGTYAEYSLFDTKVTEQWVRVHNRYKEKGYKNQASSEFFIHHHNGIVIEQGPSDDVAKGSLQECKDKLNHYINEANSCITGEPFPYTPEGLPSFEVSNLIHRAFTVSSLTGKSWTHDLTDSQLIEYKTCNHKLKESFVNKHTTKRFVIKNNMSNKFTESIALINHWVHQTEIFSKSLRGEKANIEVGGNNDWHNLKGMYVELEWNQENGIRPEILGEPLDSNIIQDSMKYYEEADIFVGKNILGKDYETSFFQYDSPLEFDTVNGDYNEGTVRVHFTDEYRKFYKIGGDFHNWCNEKGITPELYRPVPLGKLISTNIKPEEIIQNHNEKAARGQPLFYSPYIITSTELIIN